MRLSLLLLGSFVLACAGFAETPRLEIKEGDRVVLLGDALLEHEDAFGIIETRMVEQFRDRHFTVRNLSWSGDTPLGVSRASFDRPSKGWERLQEQIDMVKPTVAILGFGMAASLQELADRSGNIMLNPDPTRYGAEPMTAARFKAEYNKLLDELTKAGTTRFVLLSPIKHEDLRKERPGLPDPAAHEKLLLEYTKAIEELAKERKALYVALRPTAGQTWPPLTRDGIHPTQEGYEKLWMTIYDHLGWSQGSVRSEALRQAIVRKNQLFFHRWRPENHTYIFGFRKREQGQNAKEIPEFDPLIAKLEGEIDRLKNSPAASAAPVIIHPLHPAPPTTPALLPSFDIQDGYAIELWASNPLLEKPIQMNWDDTGRLWIASSSTYPQVNPEDVAASLAKDIADSKGHPSAGNDRIIVVSSSKPGGPPDKSTVFAEGLLIPTGVAPFRDAQGHWGCYVGQSTELLELVDTDGDGKADQRRVIHSGFGTEDTHHIVHTLKWGPNGRLYFNQSIYIHSHLETPHGMVRLNSGGILSWDPHTEKVEVHYKGFCNPWGHVWDKQGNEFETDGAGFQGITWCIPGAMYFTYENGRKIAPSISPGSYPKFASLEIVYSPHFPEDWQGSFITCDFRAHRIVHFGLNDLRKNDPPKSGFITQELPDLVRTTDVSFRPIDVRLGPDGALYVADWSNPVINHGEVDFRDPRRDHTSGRIWRITRKGAPLQPWPGLNPPPARALGFGPPMNPLAERIASEDPRTRLLAMRELARTPSVENADLVLKAALLAPPEDPYYEYAAWLSINDLAAPWTQALLAGTWKIDSAAREKQFEFALKSLDPAFAQPVLAKVLEGREIPADGSGPWIEMIGSAGGATDLGRLLTLLVDGKLRGSTGERAAVALSEAMRLRKLKPAGDLASLETLLNGTKASRGPAGWQAARLLGLWQTPHARELLTTIAKGDPDQHLRLAAIDGLREMGGAPSVAVLRELSRLRPAEGVARGAAVALAALDLRGSATQIAGVLNDLTDDKERADAWRAIISAKGAPDQVADLVTKSKATFTLTPPATTTGLRVARELGKNGQKLVAALSPAGTPVSPPPADYASTAAWVVRDGDPARGEEIYRRASLLCVSCHAIGGAGGKVGPELTSLGASAPLDYIIESVVAPAAKVKEGYFAVSATLKDGNVVVGIPVRENAQELFLRNAVGQDTPVVKANIATKEVIGSIMPAGLDLQLQPREKIDLYAFLSRLGKPGGYDASKGNVARYWALNPGNLWDAKGAQQPVTETPAYTLVDGRLTRDLLTSSLQLFPTAGESVIAIAHFQVPAAGTINLKLVGGSEVRLDGKPVSLPADKPMPVTLTAGEHTLGVRLKTKQLPEVLRLECAEARFLGN
jgi:putative heme-binding domain-containing protein